MENKRKRGGKGEDVAASFLEQKGFKVIIRNYNCVVGEMDIIARDNDCLVFIEVRSRWTSNYGTPEESITPDKIKRLTKIAKYYLSKEIGREIPCRFDFVGIEFDKDDQVKRLNHIVDIIS